MRHLGPLTFLRGLAAAACLAAVGCQCGAGWEPTGGLWISSEGSGRVYVLDARDGGRLGQLELSGDGGRGGSVAVSADGAEVYVADELAGAVSIIDTHTLEVKATVTGLARPRDVRPSADGRALFVAQAGSSELAVIDLGNHSVQRVSASAGVPSSRTQSVWVSGGDVYVVNQLASTVVALSATSGLPRWSLPVATNPTRLVVTGNGEVGYLAGAQDGVVQQLRLTGVDAPDAGPSAPVGSSPGWLSLGQDGRWLVVSNGGVEDTISLLDLSQGLVERRRVQVGAGNVGQNALSPSGDLAYVCVGIPPRVTVVDLEQQSVVATYPLPEAPQGLAYGPRPPPSR
ncbi:MAG TPA: YncE family protein [Myxococcales bacterium]|nr:YncE family protein [Myxococcales bacterium]